MCKENERLEPFERSIGSRGPLETDSFNSPLMKEKFSFSLRFINQAKNEARASYHLSIASRLLSILIPTAKA